MSVDIERRLLAAHELRKLIVHNLHHELARLHCREHVLTQGLFLHRVGERLGHLVVDISLNQCTAHVLECLGHIYLGDFAFTFQYLERAFKSLA